MKSFLFELCSSYSKTERSIHTEKETPQKDVPTVLFSLCLVDAILYETSQYNKTKRHVSAFQILLALMCVPYRTDSKKTPPISLIIIL